MAEDTNTLNYQINRVVGGHNEALKEVIRQFGVSVPASTKADDLVDKAAALGSKYSFSNFLSAGTASVFGLPSTATPEDAFKWLSKYNEHWWSVLHGAAGKGYNEVRTDLGKKYMYALSRVAQSYQYSKSISIDPTTGAVSLVSPQTITLNTVSTTYSSRKENLPTAVAEVRKLTALAPIYVKGLFAGKEGTLGTTYTDTTISYIPAGATVSGFTEGGNSSSTFEVRYNAGDDDGASTAWDIYVNNDVGTGSYVTAVKVKTVTSQVYSIPAGETTYVHSTNRSAYPDSGTQSGLTYRYLGKPFDNFTHAPRMHVGSYVGTGLTGEANKTTLTFDFTPRVVIVQGTTPRFRTATTSTSFDWALFLNGTTLAYVGSNTADFHVSWGTNNVSWYDTGGAALNTNNTTYNFVAIG